MTLIVFEGIDGTGKSTQASMLEARLATNAKELGINGVLRVAEPTKSPFGMKIREAMENSSTRLSFSEELDLFIKDRKHNVENNINPALQDGKVVILDRYYFSTAAYQGCRGIMDYNAIIEMNERFAPIPSLVFFFIAPVDVVLERIDKDVNASGRGSRTYMERRENLLKVQAIFEAINASNRYNAMKIDATLPKDEIAAIIWKSCCNLLKRS